jgi:hypothetical protein
MVFLKFPFFGNLPVTDAICTSFASYREMVLNSQLLVSMYLQTHPHIITMEISAVFSSDASTEIHSALIHTVTTPEESEDGRRKIHASET